MWEPAAPANDHTHIRRNDYIAAWWRTADVLPCLGDLLLAPEARGEHVPRAEASVDINRLVVAVNVEVQISLRACFADDVRLADDLSI